MTNLEIAQKAKLRPIDKIAEWAGLDGADYEALGRHKGKLSFEGIEKLRAIPKKGRLVLVTAINPTSAGEGKTTVSVGLAEGLNKIGHKAIPALREPALGPVFGIKGGACGGGYAQVVPMEEINLFFNGDFPAISAAHNLLSSMLDAHLYHGNALGIDLRKITWPRTVDMIDRALREIVVGLGEGNGVTRSDSFVITPASEIMAALCLATSFPDLKARIARIVVATRTDGTPVTASDLCATGAMATLLRDAIRPNLVQTLEGGAALVHGGPFGNIAHGCSSIIGTECGLGMAEVLVTEGGFGSDLGAEKFLNIVAPQLDVKPSAIVLVATIRALRMHGDGDLKKGCANLGQHIAHLKQYGPPVIVALNEFVDDTPEETLQVLHYAEMQGVAAAPANPWGCGGAGTEELAEKVAKLAETSSTFTNIYEKSDPIEDKLQKIVERVYGGRGVVLSRGAERKIAWAKDNGFGELPICVAKTQYSLTDDAKQVGAPKDFDLNVREIRVAAGAGFLVAVSGDIMLMPGMGKSPAAARIDVDDQGVISGLY